MQSDLPIYRPSTNPYWKKIKSLSGGAYTDEDCEQFKGQWRSRFAPTPHSPIHVEIGCNGGHVLLKWAERSPETLFIGIDWKFKQIYLAHEKAQKRGLKNVIFLRAHAARLPLIFAPGEVSQFFLFFPDPWPKRAHWPNRFVTAERLNMIHSLTEAGGEFQIKTDHDGYFEWMEREVPKATSEWKIKEKSSDLHMNHPDPQSLEIPEVTLFERIFIREGIKIKRLTLSR